MGGYTEKTPLQKVILIKEFHFSDIYCSNDYKAKAVIFPPGF
jgi:hypothetical protein